MSPTIQVSVKGKTYQVASGFCPVCNSPFDLDFGDTSLIEGEVVGHDGSGEFVEAIGDIPIHSLCLVGAPA